jgi:uncharacterized membrane protein YkvA (DUF1232 family)
MGWHKPYRHYIECWRTRSGNVGFLNCEAFDILCLVFVEPVPVESWNTVREVKMRVSTRFIEVLRMISRLWSDLPLLGRLLKAWKRGSYKGLSVRTIVSLAAALLYIISPIDLLPDFIPGIGLIDDAAMLGLLLHSIAQDLAAFRVWEQNGERRSSV